MGRRVTARAEIAGCVYQPAVKQMHPDAIDDHTLGQRICRLKQPAGQIKPIWLATAALQWMHNCECSGLHSFGFTKKVASDVHECRPWRNIVREDGSLERRRLRFG